MAAIASVAFIECPHVQTQIGFLRGGTRLRPKCWMVEYCRTCDKELDRVKVSRSFAEGSGREPK